MVGSRDDNRVDGAVVEESTEVAVARADPHQRRGLIATPAVHLGDRRHRRAGLVAEIEHVPLADQTETDEAHPHTVIGPGDPSIRPGRECRGDTAAE